MLCGAVLWVGEDHGASWIVQCRHEEWVEREMQVWALLCHSYLTIQAWAKGKQGPVTSLGYQGSAVDKGLVLIPRTHLVKAAGYLPLPTPGNACIIHVMFLNKKVFENKNLFTLILHATHKAFYCQVIRSL